MKVPPFSVLHRKLIVLTFLVLFTAWRRKTCQNPPLHKHLPQSICFCDNRHDSLMGLPAFGEYLWTASSRPARRLSHPGLSVLRVDGALSIWRLQIARKDICLELPLQLERDAVVGTSLHLIYSTCTLPGPNAVQIYRLLIAQIASAWWREKKARRCNVRNSLPSLLTRAVKGPSSELAALQSSH